MVVRGLRRHGRCSVHPGREGSRGGAGSKSGCQPPPNRCPSVDPPLRAPPGWNHGWTPMNTDRPLPDSVDRRGPSYGAAGPERSTPISPLFRLFEDQQKSSSTPKCFQYRWLGTGTRKHERGKARKQPIESLRVFKFSCFRVPPSSSTWIGRSSATLVSADPLHALHGENRLPDDDHGSGHPPETSRFRRNTPLCASASPREGQWPVGELPGSMPISIATPISMFHLSLPPVARPPWGVRRGRGATAASALRREV